MICSICLENTDYFSKTFECGHEFHNSCIKLWLQKKSYMS